MSCLLAISHYLLLFVRFLARNRFWSLFVTCVSVMFCVNDATRTFVTLARFAQYLLLV